MLRADAEIVVTEERSNWGQRLLTRSFEWRGGHVAMLSLSSRVGAALPFATRRPGSTFQFGPFRLRVLDEDFARNAVYVVREGFLGSALYRLHRLTTGIDRAYSRLLLTAVVWNLAEYKPECVLTYRNLYLVQWIKTKLGR